MVRRLSAGTSPAQPSRQLPRFSLCVGASCSAGSVVDSELGVRLPTLLDFEFVIVMAIQIAVVAITVWSMIAPLF